MFEIGKVGEEERQEKGQGDHAMPQLKVVDHGTMHAAVPGGRLAVAYGPGVTVMPQGASLIGTYSVGTRKDSDDITLALRHSKDQGRTWSHGVMPFDPAVDGVLGSLQVGHITALADRLICAAMWINREAFPGKPLFNPQTAGCLPMQILLADSFDDGETWTPWRIVPMPDDVGPPSLTSPVLSLADGRLALSIESNKPYLDSAPWLQRVVYLWSSDLGQTWSEPVTVCSDPSGRVANWDQRTAVSPDGRLASIHVDVRLRRTEVPEHSAPNKRE